MTDSLTALTRGGYILLVITALFLALPSCTPSGEDRPTRVEETATEEAEAVAEEAPAAGYVLSETDLPEGEVARVLDTTLTASRLTRKAESFRKTFSSGHEEAEDIRMAALLALLDEIVVEDRFASGEMGPKDEEQKLVQLGEK